MKKLLCIAVICLLGCNNTETGIYENKSFNDIYSLAQINNSSFCIVLTDSMSNLSKEYIFQLEKNYKHLFDKAIFNFSDINHIENEWYIKWLCPVSIPLTCIFSLEGKLIDLIPGVSKETFLYTEEAINKAETTEFHWPNRFNLNKKSVLPLLDNLLQHKRDIDEGVYSPLELNRLADSLNYPYSNYLKLLGELMEQDKPLKISKIHTSCSCVEQHKYEGEIIIKPKKSFPIKFYFTPDTEGEIFRDIFITSNAINMPILHITVLANV